MSYEAGAVLISLPCLVSISAHNKNVGSLKNALTGGFTGPLLADAGLIFHLRCVMKEYFYLL